MADLRAHARRTAEFIAQHLAADPAAYHLLAEHGEENTWSPLPEGEEYGKAKSCYQNVTDRVLLGGGDLKADGGLTYYEGLVVTELGMPIEHAWAQDREGRVYELTLRHNDDRCPYCHGEGTLHPAEHWAYDASTEGEYGYEGPEEMDCEMCGGSGEDEPRNRTGMSYLGIPIPTDELRRAVLEDQVYGVLWQNPERVARLFSDNEEAA